VIAVDAHGADRGCSEVAAGARRAGIPVLLFGPAAEVGGGDDTPAGQGPAAAEVVDAPVAIGPEEEPARAVRAKPEASISMAARAVGDGRARALVSAGPTGAALAAALVHVKRLRGVHRPAVAVLLPVPGAPTLLLDAGASVEARPEHLVQFGYLGAAFMEAVHGVRRPRVGLLSVGEERSKGTAAVVEAHDRLADGPLDFRGNVEGDDLTAGVCDVVVTDGFTGNVALKAVEGTARTVVGAIREAIRSGAVSSVGGLLIRRRVTGLRDQLDPNSVGGAILLGLRGVVVIAHGGSTAGGVAQAVALAQRAVDERMVERTLAALESAGALRSADAASVNARHDQGAGA
jgi:glycerol-3-phosphate acyltransferase PlsX